MRLEDIRKEIDQVDKELVALLEKRMTLVQDVIAYKKEKGMVILDQKREDIVLDKVSSQVAKESHKEPVVAVFTSILEQSRAYQERHLS